ncbi:MAG: E3 binding domain-containing protein, partial [Solirubrobacteraceae bacterium]|nr:E3 binding domain-containing protein [Solirubrobacteraceae bacterium]
MTEIVMPRLSDSMEEGTIVRWLKAHGDRVERGDELAEIETDKATMAYESDAAGVLEILAREGDTLPIGTVIARLGEPGAAAGEPGTVAAGPAAVEPIAAVPEAGPAPAPERLKASPLARRLARELGVELAGLAGSGPGGRIVKADVQSAASGALPAPTPAAAAAVAPTPAQAPTAPAPAKTPPPTPPAVPALDAGTAKGHVTITEPTRTQQLIARRMAESRATIPAFTLRTSVDMT